MSLVGARGAFFSALLKGGEARGVTAWHLEEMLRRDTPQEALEVIRPTDIGAYLASGPPPRMLSDAGLWRYLNDYLGRLERFGPPRSWSATLRIYLERYDIFNLTAVLRARHSDRVGEPPLIPLGFLARSEVFEGLGQTEGVSALGGLLEQGGLGAYASALRGVEEERAATLFALERELQDIYHARLNAAFAGQPSARLMRRLLGMRVDLSNLACLLRLAYAGRSSPLYFWALKGGYLYTPERLEEMSALTLPEIVALLERTPYREAAQGIARELEGGGSTAALERVCEHMSLKLTAALVSSRLFSPATLLWHCMFKEQELGNVRLVLRALKDALPREDVRPYLMVAA